MTKRFSQRWTGQVSYFAVKNHRWISSVFTSPNDEFFPLDETWSWAGNVTGSYRLPWRRLDLRIPSDQERRHRAAHLYLPPGRPGRRPRDRAERQHHDPRWSRTAAQRLSAQNILNLRGSKDFRLGGSRRLNIDVDVFNLLNAATPTAATFVTGPSFGYTSSVIPARIARLGVRFLF